MESSGRIKNSISREKERGKIQIKKGIL